MDYTAENVKNGDEEPKHTQLQPMASIIYALVMIVTSCLKKQIANLALVGKHLIRNEV